MASKVNSQQTFNEDRNTNDWKTETLPDEKVLEIEGGDSCKTNRNRLNTTQLKNGSVNFYATWCAHTELLKQEEQRWHLCWMAYICHHRIKGWHCWLKGRRLQTTFVVNFIIYWKCMFKMTVDKEQKPNLQ